MQQLAKKHATHAFSQFRLTNETVNNLSQFELTTSAKLVLVYLTTCYNPNKADMFPRQKTIAAKLGLSERSVVRAISELQEAGLIIIEGNLSNKYRFTSKIVQKPSQNEKIFELEKMSQDNDKISSFNDNLSPTCIEPIREQKNKPQKECLKPSIFPMEDYKILKAYAEKRAKTSVQGYINKLIRDGNAKQIIKDAKQSNANAQAMVKLAKKVMENKVKDEQTAWNPSKEWLAQRRQMLEKSAAESEY